MANLVNTETTNGSRNVTHEHHGSDDRRPDSEELTTVMRRYYLGSPEEGSDLMRAFLSIPNQSLRKAFVNLLSAATTEAS
jgi:hypothetical protein